MSLKDFLRSAILCDEVRVENTGKEILIGVYQGQIHTANMPLQMPSLTIRFEFDFKGRTVDSFKMRMLDPNSNKLFEQDVGLAFIDWSRPGAIGIGLQGIIFPIAGRYRVQGELDGTWDELIDFTVEGRDEETLAAILRERFRSIVQTAQEKGITLS
jgi:hypothetical protein